MSNSITHPMSRVLSTRPKGPMRSPARVLGWFSIGLGLAVPINTTTRSIISELISTGRVRRAWLGVAGAPAPLPPQLAARLGQRRGLRLLEVVPGSRMNRSGHGRR